MPFARGLAFVALLVLSIPVDEALAQWPAPSSPVIPEADGYVAIPNVARAPAKAVVYRAVWDATHAADAPDHILPALNMAGSELNALGVCGLPLTNARFVIVFHGSGLDGILDDAHYKARFGVPNPNLKVLSEMKKAGVELYVCGQYMAFMKVSPSMISPDVTVASDALLVLIEYQNQGYAIMSF